MNDQLPEKKSICGCPKCGNVELRRYFGFNEDFTCRKCGHRFSIEKAEEVKPDDPRWHPPGD